MCKESPNQISQILERRIGDGCGYFGFTCHYADGKFRNVIYNYNRTDRDKSLAEISEIYNLYQQILKEGH